MRHFDVTIPVVAHTYEELSDDQRRLVDMARRYTHNSYAPYSKFCVGAAILLDNGEIICGANQENVAFPSGLCAERTACFSAGARFPQAKFKAIAVAARGTDGEELSEPITPCGACRQSLLEYEMLAGENVEVLLVGRNEIYQLPSVKSLLPLTFSNF